MMTPARRHFLRVTAGQHAGPAADDIVADTSTDAGRVRARMLARLKVDELNLKQIRSVTAKIAAKRQLLPGYDPYVDGVLEADAGGDDAVLVTIMVWTFDAGLWDRALTIAAYALRHGLTAPQRFNRDLATLVLEEVAEAALKQIQDGDAGPEIAAALDRALELTADADMPDQVRAKAHKARGLMLRGPDPVAALASLRQALRLDRGCGVKTEIARLEKATGTAPAADGADGAPDPGPDSEGGT